MFGFLQDMENYEERKVNKTDYDWGMISTAKVSDGRKPYETAVKHRDYNDEKMVIVDCYDTIEEAEKGHDKWIVTMESPPEELKDIANSEIQEFIGEKVFKREQT